MKNFRNIQECIHIYAQFTHDSGKCGNVFFEDNTIYSYGYHFPMAQRINLGAMPIILVNGRSCSNSTSKHQSWTRSALSHYTQIISFGMSRYDQTTEASHKMNEGYYIRELETIANNLSVARNPAKWINEAERLNSQFMAYVTFFGLTPSKEYQTAFFNATNVNEEIKAMVKAENARQLALKKEREAETKKNIEAKIAEWLSGERLYFPRECSDRGVNDVLRVNGQNVETSKGITMTIQEAKAIYSQLLAQTLKAGDRVLNHYTVTSINGTVKIGCHTFDTQYLLTFGKSL